MLTAAVTPRGTTVSLTRVSIGPGQTAEESLDMEGPRPESTGLQTPAWPPHRPEQQSRQRSAQVVWPTLLWAKGSSLHGRTSRGPMNNAWGCLALGRLDELDRHQLLLCC